MSAFGQIGAFRTLRRLPYDAEVEYIESTGTQYIDTGVYLTNEDEIECSIYYASNNSGTMRAMGCRSSAYSPWLCFPLRNWCGDIASQGAGDYAPYRANYNKDAPSGKNLRMITGKNRRVLYVGDTIVAQNMTMFSGTFQSEDTCKIFRTTDTDKSFIGKVYWCEVRGHNNMSLIPVRFTNELGQTEGAMYDRANPTGGMNPDGSARTDGLYLNRGTGSFLYGNDIQGSISP